MQGTVVAHVSRVGYTARRCVEHAISDDQVQRFVEDTLDWADPSVDGSRIGVTVDAGVVTLRGGVDSPSERLTAERVALRVRGVDMVVNDLAVSPAGEAEVTHSQTTRDGLNDAPGERRLSSSARR